MAGRRFVRDLALRTKLVAVLLALMTLAFVLVGTGTTLALRHFLFGQLDQRVQAASDRFSVSLPGDADHDADNSEEFESVAGQSVGTLGARVRGGHVVAADVVGSRPARHGPVPPGLRAALERIPVSGSARSMSIPGLGEYRVLAVRSDESGETLITGLPIAPLDDTVHRLIAIELVVYTVALVLVALAAAALVRLTLRPLERITDTAARVATLPLTTSPFALPEPMRVPHSESEIGTLAAAFDQMLANVEQSLHARQASEDRLRTFLGDAGHELRTPVAVVRAHAELARRTAPALPPEIDHALERIVGESERMGRMVEDLLLLARLNSGRPLERVDVDLTRVVLDTVSDARVAGPDHHWRLDLPDEPVEVVGDEHALHQVLANLLANARVHTPPGTTVTTSLQGGPGDGVTIVVRDDGPGIPDSVLPEIFGRFVRADDARGGHRGGIGLGLAIVDAIVRGHGGSTEVTSSPCDTRFVVHLP